VKEVKNLLKNPKDVVKSVSSLLEENHALQKKLQHLYHEKAADIKKEMRDKVSRKGDVQFVAHSVKFDSAEEIKNILFELRNEVPRLFAVLAAEINGKPSVSVIISDELVNEKNLNAGNIVRELAKEINGGGGGQPFYAQAGGSNAEGIPKVLEKAGSLIKN
jgi:alanyl-tRNA synthetase